MKIDLGPGKKFGVKTSEFEAQYVHRWSLMAYIDETFVKKPAARASIYKSLYFSGMFDGWVEGVGELLVFDYDRHETYCAEQD